MSEGRIAELGIEIAELGEPGTGQIAELGIEVAEPAFVSQARVTQTAVEVAYVDPTPTQSTPVIAPTDGAQGKPLIPLLHLYLSSGEIKRVSMVGLVVGETHYGEGVLSFGSILREIDPQSGGFRVGEAQVELDNGTGEWSRIQATDKLAGRIVEILLGDPSEGLSSFELIYQGRIRSVKLDSGRCVISAVDEVSRRLDMLNFVQLTKSVWPNIPDTAPASTVVPIVWGNITTATGERQGQVPGVIVDPAFGPSSNLFRYALNQGELEAVSAVYIKDSLATEGVDYDIRQEARSFAFGTDFIAYADFVADPRAVADPDNFSGPEVTWDGQGRSDRFIVDFFTALTNPVDQISSMLTGELLSPFKFNWVVDFDHVANDKVRDYLDLNSVTSAWVFANQGGSLRTVLDEYANSFGLSLTVTRSGLLRYVVLKDQIEQAGEILHLVEGIHILDEGFSVETVGDVISQMELSWRPNWIEGGFYRSDIFFSDDAETEANGQGLRRELQYVREDAVAQFEAARILFFGQANRHVVTLSCDPHLYDDFEVGDEVVITHRAGPSTDGLGFRQQPFVVTSIGFDFSNPENVQMTMRLIDVYPFSKAGEGQVHKDYAPFFGAPTNDVSGVEERDIYATTQDTFSE